jgi:hypothetical protein
MNGFAARSRKRSTAVPSGNALRSRRARDRRRQGLASFRIDVSTDDFVDALVESHRLTEVQELRRRQIERELTASSESESAT